MPVPSTLLTNLSRSGIAVSTTIGVIGLCGWLLGVPVLSSFLPGFSRISGATIFCLFLCSVAVLQLTIRRLDTKRGNLLRTVAAGLALAIGLFVLADYLMAHMSGAAKAVSRPGFLFGSGFGRVAPAAATVIALLAGALTMPRGYLAGRLYAALIAVGIFITALDLVGYAFGVKEIYRVSAFAAMSLPTALAFAALLLSAVLARPDAGWIAAVVSSNSGGVTARRLLPAAITMPVLLNGLMVLVVKLGYLEASVGFAVSAVSTAAGYGIVTYAIAVWFARHERELRQSHELVQTVIENTPTVVYVKDLAGRYLMVNQRYCDIFHVDRAAMIGKTDYDIFSRDAADLFRAMDLRVSGAEEPLTEEEFAPHDDGPHAYISVKSPLRDADGQPYAIFGISTDITEHKRAAEALAASEERTRLIIETALDAVVTMSSDGVIKEWNAQAEKIFGWTRDAAIGRAVEETIMPERYRAAHRIGLARYLATGETAILNKRIQVEAIRRDGREFPAELTITPIRMGDSITFAGFIRDITERTQAEVKLQTQFKRLALLDGITRAIALRQDITSIFQIIVRSIEEQLPADFACLCLYDGVDPILTVAAVGTRSQSLAAELGMLERSKVPIDQNGLSRCVQGRLVYEPDLAVLDFPFPQRLARGGLRSLVAAPLQIESDVFGVLAVARFEPEGFASGDCEFLRQLSEHVALAVNQAQLHGALQSAYDDLRQSQQAILQQERLRALGQMASGIAHDINNAIFPISLYTESMLERETGLSTDGRACLETIQRAVEDVSQTVARMREFYRQREHELALSPMDVNRLVRQVLDLTKARWSDMPQQRGIVIRAQTDLASGSPHVMGVESEVREALINLVFNAVDALPDGGSLTLRTSVSEQAFAGPQLHIEVVDTGIGMDETTLRRCMEPFFTTKGERGTGLGLGMVYGTTQRHGADFDIRSVMGEGTKVRLSFPLVTTSLARSTEAEAARPSRLRLLIVDDDPVLTKSLRDILEADGHLVTVANGGQDGIDVFRAALAAETLYSLVITDLGMPHVDGRQVACAVKNASRITPVILLTGWGQRLDTEGDVPAHVDLVLSKPPKLRDLRKAMADLTSP